MIFTRRLKVWLAAQPGDLRRSFEGLALLVRGALREDERSIQIFVFTNRRNDRPIRRVTGQRFSPHARARRQCGITVPGAGPSPIPRRPPLGSGWLPSRAAISGPKMFSS